MKPFFSIIIPCCNVEPYIRECIDSFYKQSFQDWECLIVIEESKDRTEQTVREITKDDSRFRIFTGPQTGSCSVSRNIGTDNAKGDYVIFLDGDDSISDECLSRIYDKICENPGADLYPCAIVAYTEGTDKRELRENYPPESSPKELTGIDATLLLDRLTGGHFCPMLQLTVFRREFLVEHDLKCIPGLRRQDSEFSPRALFFAKRVVPLHEPFYLYRIRENSVSTAAKGAGYFHKDFAIIFQSLLAFYSSASKDPDFDRRIASCWTRQWMQGIVYHWFSPRNIAKVPRARRRETLAILFSNGFGDFDHLLENAPFNKRIAGLLIKLFVTHSSCSGFVEQLFLRVYHPLINLKNRTHNAGSNQDDRM